MEKGAHRESVDGRIGTVTSQNFSRGPTEGGAGVSHGSIPQNQPLHTPEQNLRDGNH